MIEDADVHLSLLEPDVSIDTFHQSYGHKQNKKQRMKRIITTEEAIKKDKM